MLGAMRTTAEPSGDGFRLNGAKMFTSGAQVADYLLVVARTRKLNEVARRGQGVSLLIVDARSPGVGIRPLRMLGLRAIGTCEVTFADVWVPREQLLGPQDDGWYRLVGTLDNERILTAAICVGVTRAVLEDAVTYARTREAFGGPIGRFQALQHYLAEIAMRLEQARLLTYHAAWLQARGRPCAREAVMAKVSASETASWAADTGIQILGGYGCAMEFDMQRYWRDVRASRVSPISNEMGRNFIAESLGLPRSY